jgi:hypothetical protein
LHVDVWPPIAADLQNDPSTQKPALCHSLTITDPEIGVSFLF